MARPPVYTPEQKQAAIAAVLDGIAGLKLSRAEVARRCAAGTLLPGLEPYTPSATLIGEWVHKARRDRARDDLRGAQPDAVAKVMSDTLESLIWIHGRELDRQRSRAEQGKAVDPGELAKLTRAAREIQTFAKTLTTGRTNGAELEPEQQNNAPADLIGQLAEAEYQNHPTHHNTHGHNSNATHHTHNEQGSS